VPPLKASILGVFEVLAASSQLDPASEINDDHKIE
jgi:hypothetical protein